MLVQRYFFRLVSSVFPNWVARYALYYLTHPQKKEVRASEKAFLATAHQESYTFKGVQIQTYTWDGKGPAVLCVHGWEGHSGNFHSIVTALQKAKIKVHAFDAPGHGASAKGATNIFEISTLVAELLHRFKTPNLISHSFGGVAACHALYNHPKIKIKKYLLFTVPDAFSERIDYVFRLLGASSKSKALLIEKLESNFAFSIDELQVSNYVPKVKVEKALVLHDAADRVIPIAQAERVVARWPNAELEKIRGTGHFKLLLNPKVVARGCAFLCGEEKQLIQG